MLKDLLRINRLATINELKFVLFQGLTCDTPVHYFELYILCKEESVNLDLAFRNMIDLLEHLTIVYINDRQEITLNCIEHDPAELNDDFALSARILEKLIESLESRKVMSKIFNQDTIKFEIESESFTINFAEIPLEFPMIKNLLVNLELVEIIENNHSKVKVKQAYKTLFYNHVLKSLTKDEKETEVSLDLESKNNKNDQSLEIQRDLRNSRSIRKVKTLLIVVATEIEAKEVLHQAKSNDLLPKHLESDKLVIWNLGTIKMSKLTMIKIGNMGSGGATGSTLSIKDAIDSIKPDKVIMVGIAFGLDKNKQQLGDILVSKQVEDYDLRKEKNGFSIQRADKIPAGISLLSRFENSQLTYTNNTVRFGLMLSGGTLSDDEEFVKKLKSKYPEAIGAEMEGSGLQGTCHREQIEWLLIKGICDWGYNKQTPNKEKDQKTAIANVCDFLFHTIKDFEL